MISEQVSDFFSGTGSAFSEVIKSSESGIFLTLKKLHVWSKLLITCISIVVRAIDCCQSCQQLVRAGVGARDSCMSNSVII